MNLYRILYVQDNTLVQNFFREKLELAGFGVQCAATIEEAVRRMQQFRPDLAVLDPLLADGDAVNAIEAIRAARGEEQFPIFVLPTRFRTLAEVIEQQPKVQLLSPVDNPAADLLARAASAVETEIPDLNEITAHPRPDARWLRAALPAAHTDIMEMRRTLQSIVRNLDSPEYVRTLLQIVHSFSDRMALTGPNAVSQLSGPLEVLIYGLVENPERLDQSALRTLGQAIDLLGSLIEGDSPARSADLTEASVMIVEDEANARELISAAMSLVGLHADGLDSPNASLAVLSAQACNLIFLDINLPEMNGFDVCTQLRAMPLHEHTPIVFITGMSTFQNRVQSNLSGGNDFVGKPFNVAELGVKALIWVLKGKIGAR